MCIKDFLALVRSRRSCRDYLGRPVARELVENCVEAARLAPSACNKQPWRFVIVEERSKLDEISSAGLLPGIPMQWLRSAPVIVVLCVEKSLLTHAVAPLASGVPYQFVDAGIAGEHFVLAAEAQGLGTCWIGWFKPGKIRKILSLKGSWQAVSLISLGYPACETAPLERLPAEKIACYR